MIISIIVPTKERSKVLYQTLTEAIDAVDGFEIEIIVVNDGGDLTNKIDSPIIQYYKNPKKGVSSARNFGASIAKSHLLFFLDDDIWISRETINAIIYITENIDLSRSVVCLNWEYPNILIDKLSNSKLGRYFIQSKYHTMEGRTHTQFDKTQTFISSKGIGSASFLIAKEVFNKIGGYNENIVFQGEDIAMYRNLTSSNINVMYYLPIVCYHLDNITTDIHNFLIRQYTGYLSQLKAEKDKIIEQQFENRFFLKNKAYKCLLPFEPIIIFIFEFLPDLKILDKVSFKIIGLLSSIQRVKASKEIYQK